jgi:DNA-binding protein YbaB
VLAAVGEAQAASEKQMNDTLGKLTGGFPLPF